MLDMIIGRVRGLVVAKDVRVIWADGYLYVAKTPTDITVIATSEPKRSGGIYKAQATSQEGFVSLQPPGCGSCRARVKASPIGQMTPEQIIETARQLADV